MSEDHLHAVAQITKKELKEEPIHIERMETGNANEVYGVKTGTGDYIIRLSQKDSLKGSSKYLPLFKSMHIQVPDIIAQDYSKTIVPYNYQVLTRLEGKDIQYVIDTLSDQELKDIAKEIVTIIKKLIVLPTNGQYGWIGEKEKLKPTWREVFEGMLDTIKERTEKTGVVKPEYIRVFQKALDKYDAYFSRVPSQFYFDDMSSKNVIINNGKFNGLVDLDGVEYGDYLEGIGRIKASWYGTRHGDTYTKAVTDSLGLNSTQREMVTVYALLNRIWWLSEIGIQFNQNTSTILDSKKIEDANMSIDGLTEDLQLL